MHEHPVIPDREILYRRLVLIRRFEQRVLELFSLGELTGTTHACIGQEANAVAVAAGLDDSDIVVSNHRCHGHYLARTGDAKGLLAEMMGRAGGVCGGRGGSQHLCRDGFYSNGVLGSTAPLAAGMAWAEKANGLGRIVTLFIGDGALGQGTVYETLNLVALWRVPLLIVIENNHYAQTTPLQLNFAGNFVGRAQAFGLSVDQTESNDVEQLADRFAGVIEGVRHDTCPHVEIIHTYRLCPHSKGDDHRPPGEIEHWQRRDPLRIQRQRLEPQRASAIETEVDEYLENVEQQVRAMPLAGRPNDQHDASPDECAATLNV